MRSIGLVLLMFFVASGCEQSTGETAPATSIGSPCARAAGQCPPAQRCESQADGTYTCVGTDMQTGDIEALRRRLVALWVDMTT